MKHNPIWFVQLSGWSVFLAIVGIVMMFMIALSIAMTWLGNRSIVQSIGIAVLFVATLAFGLLALIAYLTN